MSRLDGVPHGTTFSVCLEAGLGDVAMSLARKFASPSVVIPMRRKRPDLKFRAVVCSHCPAAHELLRQNPHIDEVVVEPWTEDHKAVRAKHAPCLSDDHGGYVTDEELEPLGVYPDPEEAGWLQAIRHKHPRYAVMHPYSSTPARDWWERAGDLVMDRAARLVADRGLCVVEVGGSYVKGNGLLRRDGWTPRPPVVVVRDFPPRAAWHLVKNADFVFGAMSAWVSLAGEFGKPTWMVNPEMMRHEFARPGDIFERFVKQGAGIRWYDEKRPHDGEADLAHLAAYLDARFPKGGAA